VTALSFNRPFTNHVVKQRYSGPVNFGVLSAYAPTVCGVASFSAALSDALVATGANVDVVRVADGMASDDARVVGELQNGSSASVAAAADVLGQRDVVMTCLDAATDVNAIVEVLGALRVPSIAVLHDVPANPSPSRRSSLEALFALADRVVVMSDVASRQLLAGFTVERRKVSIITHGARLPQGVSVKRAHRPTLLTWGLLGPGKGVERVIDAMPSLRELRGQPQYLIAGTTHPNVHATEGEAYLEARAEQVRKADLTDCVRFDSVYRSANGLAALIQSSAVVVLPYDTTEQVTSGVLVQALASGRPVVATAFPHAIELLGSGAGTIVDHDDPDAMVSALRQILADPRVAGAMSAEGRRLAPTLAWSTVAKSYLAVAQRLLSERRALV